MAPILRFVLFIVLAVYILFCIYTLGLAIGNSAPIAFFPAWLLSMPWFQMFGEPALSLFADDSKETGMVVIFAVCMTVNAAFILLICIASGIKSPQQSNTDKTNTENPN